MKLRVLGWTYHDDLRYEDAEGSFAANAAIIDEIKANGYEFSGWHHQEIDNCTPILNDGKIYRFSQRGWGGVMAEAHGYHNFMDYVQYAFFTGDEGDDGIRLPKNSFYPKLYEGAREIMREEAREELFEEDFTTRYPHPELGDDAIYTLTAEEASTTSPFDTVRQIPYALYKKLFGEDLKDTYTLDESECKMTEDSIVLPMRDELRYMGAGDEVIVGERIYLVKNIDQYKDVSEELRRSVIYGVGEEHDAAVKIFNEARVMLKIMI